MLNVIICRNLALCRRWTQTDLLLVRKENHMECLQQRNRHSQSMLSFSIAVMIDSNKSAYFYNQTKIIGRIPREAKK